MSKWETVFNNVLGSLVAGSKDDLMDRFIRGSFDSHAQCLTSIASIIADSAVKKMHYNQLTTQANGGTDNE